MTMRGPWPSGWVAEPPPPMTKLVGGVQLELGWVYSRGEEVVGRLLKAFCLSWEVSWMSLLRVPCNRGVSPGQDEL